MEILTVAAPDSGPELLLEIVFGLFDVLLFLWPCESVMEQIYWQVTFPRDLDRFRLKKLLDILENAQRLRIVPLVHLISVLKRITLQPALRLLRYRNFVHHLLSRIVHDHKRLKLFRRQSIL